MVIWLLLQYSFWLSSLFFFACICIYFLFACIFIYLLLFLLLFNMTYVCVTISTSPLNDELVNFHLGWFTKKGPHKSTKKNCVSLAFYKRFWDLWGPFLGDQPKWKISNCRFMSSISSEFVFHNSKQVLGTHQTNQGTVRTSSFHLGHKPSAVRRLAVGWISWRFLHLLGSTKYILWPVMKRNPSPRNSG